MNEFVQLLLEHGPSLRSRRSTIAFFPTLEDWQIKAIKSIAPTVIFLKSVDSSDRSSSGEKVFVGRRITREQLGEIFDEGYTTVIITANRSTTMAVFKKEGDQIKICYGSLNSGRFQVGEIASCDLEQVEAKIEGASALELARRMFIAVKYNHYDMVTTMKSGVKVVQQLSLIEFLGLNVFEFINIKIDEETEVVE